MNTGPDHHQLTRLLAWYREMGVDAPLDDEAVNWTTRGDAAPGSGFTWPPRDQAVVSRPAQARAGQPGRPAQAIVEPSLPARSAPASVQQQPIRAFKGEAPAKTGEFAPGARVKATSLAQLESELNAFEGCGLKATAKNLCLYRGAPQADLMVIGEAPGREEDLEGKPFVGPAGQLLDKMLALIGRTEANVHITNVVYWRPPGNRTPSAQETLACAPFLTRQIELVSPKVIILLGGAAAQQMLGSQEGIMRLRGKWREIDSEGGAIRALATLHPAYVLRVPASKRQVWRDLLAVRAAL